MCLTDMVWQVTANQWSLSNQHFNSLLLVQIRSASNNLEQQLAKLRAQRDSAQADLNPLKQKVRELEAAQGSHEEELERVGFHIVVLLHIICLRRGRFAS